MKMLYTVNEIKQEISIHANWFYKQLEEFRVQNQLIGNLDNGCWANDNGLVVGWIGYCPHNDQAEDNIELVFSFYSNENKNEGAFDVGIYWTDGSTIQHFIEYDNIDLDNSVQQIKMVTEQVEIQALAEMKNQMLIERPPYYHKY